MGDFHLKGTEKEFIIALKEMLYEKGVWSGANSREEASMSKISSSWGEYWDQLIIVKAWLDLGNDLVVKDKITTCIRWQM